MSDYLWDKTGEPDAETERLEELLGQLRFQPTPFDLPAGLPAKEFRAARTRNVLSWPRLAVAASLTLAVLAGAWLMFRQQAGVTNGRQRVAEQNAQPNAGEKHSTVAAPKATEAANGSGAGGENKLNEKPAAVTAPQGGAAGRGELAGGRLRPRVPDLDKNRSRRLPRVDAPHVSRGESASAPKRQNNLVPPGVEPRREERAKLIAEREAAEKVLYALRVTSEKLNYARQQVHEVGRAEDNR